MKKLAILLACICTALSVPAADLVMEFKLNEGSGTVVKDTAGSITGNVIFPENTKWDAGREENSKALYFTGVADKSRKGGSVILPRGKVDLPDRVGTRHRAAIGISEETDAVVVVVSEETGILSISTRGILKRDLLPEQLEESLRQLIMEHPTADDVDLAEREEE